MKKVFMVLMAVAVAAMASACEQPAENGGVTVINTVNIDFSNPDVIDNTDFDYCNSDNDCAEGEACNSQGICVIPGEDGQNGENGHDGTPGEGFEKCPTEVECGTNETCNSQGICVPTLPNCESNEECGEGELCNSQGICTIPGQNGENGTNGVSCEPVITETGCVVIKCGELISSEICSGKDGKDAPVGRACSVNADCDDGDWCTIEVCDQETSSCISALIFDECISCDADADCDDGDPCTDDSCSWAFGWCYHSPKTDCTVEPEPAECQWDTSEAVCCESSGPNCVVAGWLGQPTPDADGQPETTVELQPGQCWYPTSGPATSSICSATELSGGHIVNACALKAGGVGKTHDGICAN